MQSLLLAKGLQLSTAAVATKSLSARRGISLAATALYQNHKYVRILTIEEDKKKSLKLNQRPNQTL